MNTKTFVTANTELAAFLISKKHRFDEARLNGSRVEFVFADHDTVQLSVSSYAADEPVGAKSLMESYRLVRSLAKDTLAGTGPRAAARPNFKLGDSHHAHPNNFRK